MLKHKPEWKQNFSSNKFYRGYQARSLLQQRVSRNLMDKHHPSGKAEQIYIYTCTQTYVHGMPLYMHVFM